MENNLRPRIRNKKNTATNKHLHKVLELYHTSKIQYAWQSHLMDTSPAGQKTQDVAISFSLSLELINQQLAGKWDFLVRKQFLPSGCFIENIPLSS